MKYAIFSNKNIDKMLTDFGLSVENTYLYEIPIDFKYLFYLFNSITVSF